MTSPKGVTHHISTLCGLPGATREHTQSTQRSHPRACPGAGHGTRTPPWHTHSSKTLTRTPGARGFFSQGQSSRPRAAPANSLEALDAKCFSGSGAAANSHAPQVGNSLSRTSPTRGAVCGSNDHAMARMHRTLALQGVFPSAFNRGCPDRALF